MSKLPSTRVLHWLGIFLMLASLPIFGVLASRRPQEYAQPCPDVGAHYKDRTTECVNEIENCCSAGFRMCGDRNMCSVRPKIKPGVILGYLAIIGGAAFLVGAIMALISCVIRHCVRERAVGESKKIYEQRLFKMVVRGEKLSLIHI